MSFYKWTVGYSNYGLEDLGFLFEKMPNPRNLIDSPMYSSLRSQLRIRRNPRIFEKIRNLLDVPIGTRGSCLKKTLFL
jgi:hypothetical protein